MVDHHPLYNSLSSIVGSKYVSDEEFINYSYSMDSSPMPKKIPGIAVRPVNTEEVSEILRLANNTKTPVIPRGGGASIKGVPPGIPGISIIMDLTRMNRIIEINEENMTVTAECGITVSELDSKVRNKGYYEKYGFKRFDWILPYQNNAIFVGIEYFFDDNIPGAKKRAIELYKEYEEWGVREGAILVAVQGFETEIMVKSFSPTYFSLLKSIKGALDPNNILNSGLLI